MVTILNLILVIGGWEFRGTVGWKIESASLGFLCILVRLRLDTCALVQYLAIRSVLLSLLQTTLKFALLILHR